MVADEVRRLAGNSAEAADQSRLLIEDTINKAMEGRRIASDTSATFDDIVNRTGEITNKIGEISDASHDQ